MRVHCHVVEVNLVIATGPIRPHDDARVASVAAGAKLIDPWGPWGSEVGAR
jgi:hypothetical protein